MRCRSMEGAALRMGVQPGTGSACARTQSCANIRMHTTVITAIDRYVCESRALTES